MEGFLQVRVYMCAVVDGLMCVIKLARRPRDKFADSMTYHRNLKLLRLAPRPRFSGIRSIHGATSQLHTYCRMLPTCYVSKR